MKPPKRMLVSLVILGALLPSSGRAGFIQSERTTTYELKFDLSFFQKAYNAMFLRYEFLSWEEVDLQELFIKFGGMPNSPPMTEVAENPELVILSLTPRNFSEAVRLNNTGEHRGGFIRFIKFKNLSAQGMEKMMDITNFLYKAENGEAEFRSINFIADKDEGSIMTWKMSKERSGDRYLIKFTIMEAALATPNKFELLAEGTAALNSLDRVIEKMIIKVDAGPKITITRKAPKAQSSK
ncbi:MAG: hypothetical protein Q8P76_00805 [bacterium]|nr:hypothetical protein [bacterium]